MRQGIRPDLQQRFEAAHREGTCVFAESSSDAHRLRRALVRGELISPAPRLYALPMLWKALSRSEQELFRIRGLSQLHPDWVFASYSAALVHGLAVSYRLMDCVHVAQHRNARSRNTGCIQRHTITNDRIEVVNGIRVSSFSRTLYDAANSCAFPEGLALMDSALRTRGITSDALVDSLAPLRGPQRAIETAALANGLAENGGESVARAVMIAQGYMPPRLQVEVPDIVDASSSYRVDFFWHLATGDVAGELDGHEKYVNPAMTNGRDIVDILIAERRRESHVTGSNMKVMRFSYREVMNTRGFCHLLSSFGVPNGYPVPWVAR